NRRRRPRPRRSPLRSTKGPRLLRRAHRKKPVAMSEGLAAVDPAAPRSFGSSRQALTLVRRERRRFRTSQAPTSHPVACQPPAVAAPGARQLHDLGLSDDPPEPTAPPGPVVVIGPVPPPPPAAPPVDVVGPPVLVDPPPPPAPVGPPSVQALRKVQSA